MFRHRRDGAVFCFIVALVLFARLPAQAQGPTTNLTALVARVTALETALAAETVARETADTTEAAAREGADTALQTNINNEAVARTGNDTTLNARVEKLEGTITAADLVGTYSLTGFQNELHGAPPTVAPQTLSYVFVGTVTLAADFTTSYSATQTGHKLSMGTRTNADGSETGTFGSWAYADGTVTASNGNIALNVTAGGRVLLGAGANHDDGTTVILIFTRLQ